MAAVEPLRVGVIGTGFGRYHMEGFKAVEGVEVHAVCDLNEEEARFFADKFGAKQVVTDYKALCAMDKLDAISIAVPNFLHAPMAICALEHGKHVLVEKPMAPTVAEAEQMVAAAKKAGKRLMVEQALRFTEDAQILRAYYERGELGEVYFAKATWTRRKGWPSLNFPPGGDMGRGQWFIEQDKAGFGALGDIGVHFIDLAWYLMGNPRPVTVSGQLWPALVAKPLLEKKGLPASVEETAVGCIRFENGAMLFADVCWDSYQEELEHLKLFGDKGGASLSPAKFYRGLDIMETVDLTNTFGGFDTETAYAHFISCIREPEKPMIAAGEENVHLIKMLNGIAQSAKEGREVVL